MRFRNPTGGVAAPSAHAPTHLPAGSDAIDWQQLLGIARPETDPFFPTFVSGAKAANYNRIHATAIGAILASQRLGFTMMPVWPGLVINWTAFVYGAAGVGPTNYWHCLIDVNTRQQLAHSADQLTAAVPVGAVKVNLITPYVVPAGVYKLYAGKMFAGTTPPTEYCTNGANNGVVASLGSNPQLSGSSTGGLTAPVADGSTFAAFAAGGGGTPYVIYG